MPWKSEVTANCSIVGENPTDRLACSPCTREGAGVPVRYGYQWWTFANDLSAALHAGAFTAEDIFGQFIYVNPAHRVVAVVRSDWSEPWVTELEFETFALLGTAVAVLAS